MCINKRWIYNKYGKKILVKCGKCDACQQEKAFKRTARIKNHVSDDYLILFVTLTFRNDCIPYFLESDYNKAKPYIARCDDSILHEREGRIYKSVPIYRDCFTRFVRRGSSYKSVLSRVHERQYLCDASLPAYENQDFKYLKNQSKDKVGIILFSDFQNFFKRLKINLSRSEYPSLSNDFSFFLVTEYGPSSCRPHAHILLFIPKGAYNIFKRAIIKSWTFDSRIATADGIQIARNPASYVSSYVNSHSTVPSCLAESYYRQKHSFSKGFGFALFAFSLDSVLQKFRQRNLRYDCMYSKGESFIAESRLLPSYVISRYFPKVKGYFRLNVSDIYRICQNPDNLIEYAERLDYSVDDLFKYSTLLRNKIKTSGLNPIDYAIVYSEIWTLRASNVLEDFYKAQASPLDTIYSYDNLDELLTCEVDNPSLLEVAGQLPQNYDFILDPNLFPANLAEDEFLRYSFNWYNKDKKARNAILSLNHNF